MMWPLLTPIFIYMDEDSQKGPILNIGSEPQWGPDVPCIHKTYTFIRGGGREGMQINHTGCGQYSMEVHYQVCKPLLLGTQVDQRCVICMKKNDPSG